MPEQPRLEFCEVDGTLARCPYCGEWVGYTKAKITTTRQIILKRHGRLAKCPAGHAPDPFARTFARNFRDFMPNNNDH